MQRVHSCPNTHSAGLLSGRRLEHFSPKKERMVQGVRFSLTSVPKNGDHLEELIWTTTQSADKVLLILHLRMQTRSAQSL